MHAAPAKVANGPAHKHLEGPGQSVIFQISYVVNSNRAGT
jgi:hypothetical protein